MVPRTIGVTGEHVYTEIQRGLEFNKFDKERENFYAQSVGKRAGAKTPRLHGLSLCLISRACPFIRFNKFAYDLIIKDLIIKFKSLSYIIIINIGKTLINNDSLSKKFNVIYNLYKKQLPLQKQLEKDYNNILNKE